MSTALFTNTEMMAAVTPTPAGAHHLDLPAEEYHACTSAISSGHIEDFREDRRLYEGRYVTKTIPLKTQTDAMRFGTLIHWRLLETESYFQRLGPLPPENAPDGKKWLRRKGSDHEKWWNEYLAKCEGKEVVDEEERAAIEAIAESVLSKRHAKRLLERRGQSEYSIFWCEDGQDQKCRVDWFSDISIDIKTADRVNPFGYAKKIVNLGYHRKLAHYKEGLSALTGEKNPPLIHIAVCTQPPYSVAVYDINDRDTNNLSLGWQQRRTTLREIAECRASNDFSNSYEHEIIELKLPSWAFSEDAWNVG